MTIGLMYRKAIPSNNDSSLIFKDFKCEVELLDSVTISLKLIDPETKEEKKEVIELSKEIKTLAGLRHHLVSTQSFY